VTLKQEREGEEPLNVRVRHVAENATGTSPRESEQERK